MEIDKIMDQYIPNCSICVWKCEKECIAQGSKLIKNVYGNEFCIRLYKSKEVLSGSKQKPAG